MFPSISSIQNNNFQFHTLAYDNSSMQLYWNTPPSYIHIFNNIKDFLPLFFFFYQENYFFLRHLWIFVLSIPRYSFPIFFSSTDKNYPSTPTIWYSVNCLNEWSVSNVGSVWFYILTSSSFFLFHSVVIAFASICLLCRRKGASWKNNHVNSEWDIRKILKL